MMSPRAGMALLFAASLATVGTVHAEESGCTQAAPCPWVMDVDEIGFVTEGDPGWAFTEGEWIEVLLFNHDEEAHTVTFQGQAWAVDPFGLAAPAAFEVQGPGTYALSDEPTGDAFSVVVTGEFPEVPADTDPATGASGSSAGADSGAMEAEEADDADSGGDDESAKDADEPTPGIGAAAALAVLGSVAWLRRRGAV